MKIDSVILMRTLYQWRLLGQGRDDDVQYYSHHKNFPRNDGWNDFLLEASHETADVDGREHTQYSFGN